MKRTTEDLKNIIRNKPEGATWWLEGNDDIESGYLKGEEGAYSFFSTCSDDWSYCNDNCIDTPHKRERLSDLEIQLQSILTKNKLVSTINQIQETTNYISGLLFENESEFLQVLLFLEPNDYELLGTSFNECSLEVKVLVHSTGHTLTGSV